MEIQKIVLLSISGTGKSCAELSEITKLKKQQASSALLRLFMGGVINRVKQGKKYIYTGKQCELDL